MSRPRIEKEKFEQIVDQVYAEYLFAVHRFPSFDNPQKALAVIERQYLQLQRAIEQKDNDAHTAKQAIELAAMAIRYLIDLGKIPETRK